LGVIPAPAPHRPFSDRSYPLATRKFTPKEIKAAIAHLPKKDQKKIPKSVLTKSQDVAGIFGTINNALGSKTGLVIMDLLLGAFPAVKDGGKIYKKKKPARKAKIAKVMKRKK
tara:strand:+ start:229 stop:567 length:339 start_codon:yes stop_codon:yes gene_type:complete